MAARQSAKSPSASVHQCVGARPASASSVSKRSRRNFALTWVRRRSPSASSTSIPSAGTWTTCAPAESKPMSTHSRSGVPEGAVLEAGAREVGTQLTVEMGEPVSLEALAQAGGIVVGGFDARWILDQIEPEEQRVLGLERAASARRNRRARPPRSSRASSRGRRTGGDRRARQCVEVALVVADDRVYGDVRVLLGDRVRARDEHFLAHVERREGAERARGGERVQEEPGLLRGPRAELDERRRARLGRDLVRVVVEDLRARVRVR